MPGSEYLESKLFKTVKVSLNSLFLIKRLRCQKPLACNYAFLNPKPRSSPFLARFYLYFQGVWGQHRLCYSKLSKFAVEHTIFAHGISLICLDIFKYMTDKRHARPLQRVWGRGVRYSSEADKETIQRKFKFIKVLKLLPLCSFDLIFRGLTALHDPFPVLEHN